MKPIAKYVYKPYSEAFPTLFEKEKKRIAANLGGKAVIEHVGSTAIPNMGGKGVIDLAVAVNRDEIDAVTDRLQNLGYQYKPEYSTSERRFFKIYMSDQEEGTRLYHLHLLATGSEEWKDLLAFRDYLRSHPDDAKKYAEIKKMAAEEASGEGKTYRAMKDATLKAILEKAKE